MGEVASAMYTPRDTPQQMLVQIQIDAARHRQKKRRRRKYKARSVYVRREERCRDILEQLVPGTTWNAAWPAWNVNPAMGRVLEIDCLCDGGAMRVAVEVDGTTHEKYSEHFHKTEQAWEDQRRRDHVKSHNCRVNGYHLIRVPPRDRLCDSQLALFLAQELAKVKVPAC